VASLRCIFDHLAANAGSVIWATSTPVDESLHGGIDMPRWHASDVLAYNRLSVEVALGYGFRINDLHSHLSGATAGLFMPDGVHFNHVGNQLIGHHIATAILQVA
jgi:lysophospholipase L1-like esterase